MSDVVTFGEAMVRLSPPNFLRLEQTRGLDVQVGGGEFNVAVGVTRFGLSSSWVSRLPDNPLGRLIDSYAKQFGVDTSHVEWADDARCGLYFLEFGAAPRPSSVVYDRADSAISKVQPGTIYWGKVFDGAKLLHTSGITPALGPNVAETTAEALKAAKSAGVKVTYDLNYRAKLWTQAEAEEIQSPMMENVDVLITTEEDTARVFGIEKDTYDDVAVALADKFGLEGVAITLRDNLSVWKNGWTAIAYRASDGEFIRTNTYEIEIVDRVGGGDSFSAGFVAGYLDGDWQAGVDHGVAFSALKHSMPGDVNWSTKAEVDRLLSGGGLRITR
ncbi:MAG: sugar kinase [Candidatus Latescibacteria bacterium]|nr:sugar kinase [Candidatus Latescibacterota bacterium]